jgi:hypothetical protein
LAELGDALERSSTLVVRLNAPGVTGLKHAVHDALRKGCHEPERIEFIDVEDGSHVESDIGHHFSQPTMSAAEFATRTTTPRVTIVLTPTSARARERCRQYLAEVNAERPPAQRTCPRLVLAWNSSDDPVVPEAGGMVSFDGRLSVEEMHAYVTLRMVGHRGPGSTSLARHLVTEFAGSDAMLAEELMSLSHEDLLNLPQSLSRIAHLAGGGVLSVAAGAVDSIGDSVQDWLTSRSAGSESVKARERLDSRYWRACVRALLPWLEERRRLVIDILRSSLEDYLYPSGGKWRKVLPWRPNETLTVEIDDLEFNDVVAMSRHANDPFVPLDASAQQALEVCRSSKRVRDALAHMRPPGSVDVQNVIRLLDNLLPYGG